MKRLIVKIIIFISPIIIVAINLEVYNRINNTFWAKKEYIETNKDSIEVLILGSSQTWRAINPEYLSVKTAPLAHGGSAFNIDYLLVKKFLNELPNLQVLILEASYHTFEDYRDKTWNKNHLFYIYYNINNYNGYVPITERLLVTANPKAYINRIFTSTVAAELGEYNKYGYITGINSTLDETRYSPLSLKNRHNQENLNNYRKNKSLLKEIIYACKQKEIDVVFFSPPKYQTYNQNNNIKKINRRNQIISKYQNSKGFHIWNYEKKYENIDNMFYNEDHLNAKGAEILSLELDIKLQGIIQSKANN